MSMFRVTKFNPSFRDAEGRYLLDDWTSLTDVGKFFTGTRLTQSEYLKVEDAYVETVRRFLLSAGIASVRVTDAEQKDTFHVLSLELKAEIEGKNLAIEENTQLSAIDIDWAVRLNLRELFWCRLEGERGLYIHFGYDYYMYLGIDDVDFALPLLPSGMFAELCESPYKK